MIPIQEVNAACKHAEKGGVRFRYVIDMAFLKQKMEAAPASAEPDGRTT